MQFISFPKILIKNKFLDMLYRVARMYKEWQELFLLKYSFFGIPWIISGGVLSYLVQPSLSVSLYTWFFIFLAFFSARTAGMGFNRIIDAKIDEHNPRTKLRAIPRGDLSKVQVLFVSLCCVVLFLFACHSINRYVWFFSPFVLFLLIAYSYTKRITSWCHFVLGLIHALGPIVSFAAISGKLTMTPLLLSMSVFVMIASGDIFYALQDIDFDRRYGLYSIPARFGEKKSVFFARVLQVVAVLSLWVLGIQINASDVYFLFCFIIAILYFLAGFKKKPVFLMNVYIGFLVMCAFIGEWIWRQLL